MAGGRGKSAAVRMLAHTASQLGRLEMMRTAKVEQQWPSVS
jgi:hypothetical protein